MSVSQRIPMKLSFHLNARKTIFVFVAITIVLATITYVNLTLMHNTPVGPTHRLRSALPNQSHPVDLGTSDPTSSFYRRGKNFDTTVSRERAFIMCLHDKMLNLGLSLIRELRCLGNQDLIQVYYCKRAELSAQSANLLFLLDNRLELVDVCSDYMARGVVTADLAKTFQSYWIKVLALCHTDVRHVILLDADNIVFRDPTIVRSLDGYVETGTTFFYDRVRPGTGFFTRDDDGDMYLHKLLHQFDYAKFNVSGGYAPSQHLLGSFAFNGWTYHEMDSSMVVIDKQRAGKAVMNILFWFSTEERFRFKYSWGDKETFWLAFELAHVPYAFSPWSISAVDSMPNEDMTYHPDTLCNSMLHFMPDPRAETPEILFVNGKALIDPYPQGLHPRRKVKPNNRFNTVPTHMTPRQERKRFNKAANSKQKFNSECLVGMGSTPLPGYFFQYLLRHRLYFFGLSMGVLGSLEHCDIYSLT